MEKRRILIVEDEDFQYEIYQEALTNYELIRANTGTEAIAAIRNGTPDLIVLDHILANGQQGLDFLPQLRELLPFVPVIVVSGALAVPQQLKALQGPRRAHYCIAKPVDVHELQEMVQIALEECGEAEVIRRFEALERSKRIDVDALLSRSADRLSRQNEILQMVKNTKGRPNVSALARHFRVARRTIIRDLQELIRRGQVAPEVFPKWEEFHEEGNSPP
jgi:DNA-binding NtrC family response regulator